MRIVKEWQGNGIKYTIFHYNERYSIKLEKDGLEQTYKFRHGQVEGPADIEAHVSNAFISQCLDLFVKMSSIRNTFIPSSTQDFEFPEII